MPPADKTKASGIQVHGSIHHFSRKAGRLIKCRRWAYVNQDSLLIFPDAYTSGHCYRIHLVNADISISYEDEDNPLIAITEKNNNMTYLIQPEKPYKFQKWLSAIHKASRTQSNDTQSTSFPKSSTTNVATYQHRNSISGVQPVSEDTPDFTPLMKPVKHQLSAPSGTRTDLLNPMPVPRTNNVDNPPAIPKRIALPWDRNSGRVPTVSEARSSTGSRNGRWVTGQPAPPARTSRRAPLSLSTTVDDVPPPRPPRNALALKTVKEHPNMRDSQIVPTKSLDEVKSRYPVSGLAKRMSISASDLLGKSRDELILLLLQLNREKANLQRWHDYFTQQIDLIRSTKRDTPEANKEIEAIEVELKDVNGQLSLSEPLVTFLSNMLRMGDLYGGDDVLFASEYRKHLLPAHEVVPPKPSLTLAREVEAREIARSLNASKRKLVAESKRGTRSSTVTEGSCTLANWIAQNDQADVESSARSHETHRAMSQKASITPSTYYQESASMRMRRIQLEAELADLEALCAPHSAIHQRLRETQQALRPTEVNRPRELQGSLSHATGPSAALLRRLRAEQYSNNRRSGTDSFRGRSHDEDFRQPLDWLDRFKPDYESHRHTKDLSGGITPRRRNQSASAQTNRFTPIGGEPLNHNGSLRRFRSIPDNLNLLGPEDNGSNENVLSKSYDWEPLNRPLHTPKPLRGSSNKFAALQPEVFVPTQTTFNLQSRQSRNRASRFDTDQFGVPSTMGGNYEPTKTPVGSNCPLRYTPSDRLFHEWSQTLRDVRTNTIEPYNRRPNSESLPNERSVFGYPNLRIDRISSETVDNNRDIPRVVRAYSSNTNQLCPNYSSPDLRRTPDVRDSPRLEKNAYGSGKPVRRNRVSKEWEVHESDDVVDLMSSWDSNPRSPRFKLNPSAFHDYEDDGRPCNTVSNIDGAHTINLLNQNQWGVNGGRRISAENSADLNFVSRDRIRDLEPEARHEEQNLGQWFQATSKGSLLNEAPEVDRTKRALDCGFAASQDSSDQCISPRVKRQTHTECQQKVKPRMRRASQDYLFTAESIESVFTPPEPMKITERYVPTPPTTEPMDADYRHNKEVRLNALREVLLRQRLSGDYDGSSPPKARLGQNEERIQQNAHLISMQEKLAKDAVASVFQLTSARFNSRNQLNA